MRWSWSRVVLGSVGVAFLWVAIAASRSRRPSVPIVYVPADPLPEAAYVLPNLMGLTETEAFERYADASEPLAVQFVWVDGPERVPTIVAQNPAPGTVVSSNATLRLTLSQRPPPAWRRQLAQARRRLPWWLGAHEFRKLLRQLVPSRR